jgi:hypothetical protein
MPSFALTTRGRSASIFDTSLLVCACSVRVLGEAQSGCWARLAIPRSPGASSLENGIGNARLIPLDSGAMELNNVILHGPGVSVGLVVMLGAA